MKRIALYIILFLFSFVPSGCGISTTNKTENFKEISVQTNKKRLIFNKFLKNTNKILLKINAKKNNMAFISYAWESPDKSTYNDRIQIFLSQMHSDLEMLGVDTFLDIKRLSGNIRESLKENLKKSNIIFVIGTSNLKEKSRAHKVFLLPYFELSLVPLKNNVIALVKAPDFYSAYYIEHGIYKEVIMTNMDMSSLQWKEQENGVKEARVSENTNIIIEKLLNSFSKVENKHVTNVQYEMGIYMDKINNTSTILLPLSIENDYDSSFPSIIKEFLIRNVRKESDYFYQMFALSNPLGIIPTIFPELIKNHEYVSLVEKLEKDLN